MNQSTTRVVRQARCEKVVVTTGDGRVFNLGRPTSRLFKMRMAAYKWRRRNDEGFKEFN